MIQLRDYQARDVERIRQSFASGHRAPLYVGATGMGKTVIFAHIAQAAHAKGKRVTILVHRQELLTQASSKLAALGIAHGRIAPHARNTRDTIQVASVQTLARRLDRVLNPPDLLIIDEAAHAVAGQWKKIIAAFPTTKILGVTATPERLDGQGLGVNVGGIFDDLILGPPISELIRNGYLCNAEVYAPSTVDLSGIHRRGSDFDAKELSERMESGTITGDAVAHYQKLCDGKSAIAFCVSIMHAEHVAEQFRNSGYTAMALSGKTDSGERKQAIEHLGDGRLQVLTSCDIVSEGTDIPRVEVIIDLRPTESLALYLQHLGRAGRLYEGKQFFIQLDHAGNALRHGMYDEDREWTLEGKKRKKNDATAISVRQCSECYRVYRAFLAACPGCGHRPKISKPREVEQVEGELVKLDRERAEFLAKKRAHDEVKACKTLEDLQELGRKRGYKSGWSIKRWEIIQMYAHKRAAI